VNDKFRKICGVPEGAHWPEDLTAIRTNPVTNEIFYTPDFLKSVKHGGNVEIFERVSAMVWEDIQVSQRFQEWTRNRTLTKPHEGDATQT
jgi:hypothetical protein